MINYQFETDKIIKKLDNVPRLFLHACCAPCSSYVTEYLSEYFDITVFFYNPNITEYEEYLKRKNELIRFISEMKFKNPVSFIDGDYSPEAFFEISKGREELCEGGARCFDCYLLRLEKTAVMAKQENYDYFCTTLSVSPHKNSQKLNEIGGQLSEKYGIKYLFSDFKKRNGYKRSIELSAQYNLYRQNYCGCIYSKAQSEKKGITEKE
ncbi:MAG: epoxyqueuosine reductase QueH [Ruminiclostridium sp.]|nr:epoxyqueuosine reductase QueH [Ruminiclostridium sp.]